MKFVVAYNPTDGPVVIDDEGRTLGGRERGPVDQADPAVKAAVDDGRLILVADPGKEATTTAKDNAAQAKALNERLEQLQSLTPDDLAAVAVDAGAISEDDAPTKTELVALLVRSDAEIPTAAPPSSTPAESPSAPTKEK